MPFPNAAGHPDYSASGTSKFIPEVWSGKLVTKFYAATVFGDIASTDYEGNISDMGDKVYIRTRATITIRDYERGGGVTSENPTSPNVVLNIDHGKYFSFALNDVDKVQTDLQLLDDWSDDASQQMKITIDKDLLGNIYADVDAANAGATAGKDSQSIDLGVAGTPLSLTNTNIIDFIVDLGTVLDEQSVPEEARWLVLPPWACALIKKSDLKNASLSGDAVSPLRNGKVGTVDRFMIYNSNNLSTVTDGANRVTNVVAGHSAGLTFASQMTKMETLPNPNDFGQLVRGLNVYGYKVIEGKYLAHGYVTKG